MIDSSGERTADSALDAWPGWTHAALLALFTAGMLVAHGYGFGSEDSANYLMFVRAWLDPAAFPHDDFFAALRASAWHHHATFFVGLAAGLARILTVEGAFFALHLAALGTLIVAVWLIGRAIGGAAVGWLTLLALLGARWVGGTYMLVVPAEAQTRSVAAALAFLALALLANGWRPRWAAGLAGMAALFHPTSALMALPVVAVEPLLAPQPWGARLREAATAVALALAPLAAWQLLRTPGPAVDAPFLAQIDATWQALIDFRLQGQALNVGAWPTDQWLLVLVPIGAWLLALTARREGCGADRVLGLAMVASVGLAALGIVGADVYRLTGPTLMMLSRLLYLPLVVGTAYGAWWLLTCWRAGGLHERIWVAIALAAWSAAAMPVVLMALLPLVILRAWRSTSTMAGLAQAFGIGWAGLAFAVALRGKLLPVARGAAAPDMLVFAEPPLANVLVLAIAGALLLVVAHALARSRAGTATVLATSVAVSPLAFVVLTNRAVSPAEAVGRKLAALELPGRAPFGPRQALAAWARANTPAEARFLTPLELKGFRALAVRPIVTDWKDGGIAMFSPPLARRWKVLYEQVFDYDRWPPENVLWFAREQGCSYVVMPLDRPLPAPIAYRGDGFSVYAVSPIEGRASLP